MCRRREAVSAVSKDAMLPLRLLESPFFFQPFQTVRTSRRRTREHNYGDKKGIPGSLDPENDFWRAITR